MWFAFNTEFSRKQILSKSDRRGVKGKHLMHFPGKISASQFLWCCVIGQDLELAPLCQPIKTMLYTDRTRGKFVAAENE